MACPVCQAGVDGAGGTCPTCLGTGRVAVDHPDERPPHEVVATPDGVVLLPYTEPDEWDDGGA